MIESKISMLWISLAALLFATINAVQFYGDNGCSCSEDQCCDDKNYTCICFSDDDSSIILELTSPLPFYGQNYTYVYINTNGILILLNKMMGVNETLYYFKNDPFPIEGHVFIAPFYGDIDTRSKGIVWYSKIIINDSDLLKKAEDHVRHTEYKDFCPEYLLIATWDDVGYYDQRNDKLNTFQCVIATDGNTTFAIFLYNKIEWTTAFKSTPAKVGFNDGLNNRSWEMPCSGTEDISMLTSSSNIGEPGVWIFQVDGTDIIPACPNEDDLSQCEIDGLCSCLTEDVQQKCQCQNNTVCTKIPPIIPGPGNPTNDDSALSLLALLVLIPVVIAILIFILCGMRARGGNSEGNQGNNHNGNGDGGVNDTDGNRGSDRRDGRGDNGSRGNDKRDDKEATVQQPQRKLKLEDDDIEVDRLLQPLQKEELKQLFRILGLSPTKVDNKYHDSVTAYRDDLIRSWIQEDGKVIEKGGATWTNLQDALRSMDKTGIASKI